MSWKYPFHYTPENERFCGITEFMQVLTAQEKNDDGDNEINVIVDYNEEKEDSEKVQPKKKIMQS